MMIIETDSMVEAIAEIVKVGLVPMFVHVLSNKPTGDLKGNPTSEGKWEVFPEQDEEMFLVAYWGKPSVGEKLNIISSDSGVIKSFKILKVDPVTTVGTKIKVPPSGIIIGILGKFHVEIRPIEVQVKRLIFVR